MSGSAMDTMAGPTPALEARACAAYLRYDSTVELVHRIASELDGARGVRVRTREVGRSSEDRPLLVVTMDTTWDPNDPVSGGRDSGEDDLARGPLDPLEILVVGGMHAREWISSASVLCLMVRHFERLAALLTVPQQQQDARRGLRLTFFPNLNPDGYAYTRTTQRSWRRTRTPLPGANKNAGIDLNRNFGVANRTWGFGRPDASSSELYQGAFPFEAVEAQALRDVVLAGTPARRVVLDVHCCAKVVFPVYRASEARVEEATRLAEASQGVLRYRARSDVIDAKNTGIAVDWMEEFAGVRAAFMLEVPGKAQPVNFHDLFRVPSTSISPTSDMLERILTKAVDMYAGKSAEEFASSDGTETEEDPEQELRIETYLLQKEADLATADLALAPGGVDLTTGLGSDEEIIIDAFSRIEQENPAEPLQTVAVLLILTAGTLSLCVILCRRSYRMLRQWRLAEARRRL